MDEKEARIKELLELLGEWAKTQAEFPYQSCYDLYCDISNKRKNPFDALLIAYELGKCRMKADLPFAKREDDKLNK